MKLKTLYKSVVEHAIHVAVLVRLIPTPDHIERLSIRSNVVLSFTRWQSRREHYLFRRSFVGSDDSDTHSLMSVV